MFTNKKVVQQLTAENEQLKKELEQMTARVTARDERINTFFENIREEILSTITQHEKVNAQHDDLGYLVEQLKKRFDSANESIIKAYDCSVKIDEQGEELLNSSKEMVEESVVGQSLVEDVQNMVQILGEQMKENTELMKEVGTQSEQINEVVALIQGIADETNLLALNASIEAARAGEHGRGFTIVAEKVRDLSEETALRTRGISELTRNFQNRINETITSTLENLQLVEKGINLSRQATGKITDIEKIINVVEDKVLLLRQYIDEQNKDNSKASKEMELAHKDFQNANEMIVSHIEEAEIVDKQLEKGVSLLTEISSQSGDSFE